MSDFLGPLMRALGFLTRLPIKSRWFSLSGAISTDAGYFPVAGAIIGFFTAFCLCLASFIGFNDWVSAIIAVFATIALTGALHEDGLADVADAFFVRKSVAERLTIMKDSRIGTYGTLALLFSVFLRIALVVAILTSQGQLHAAAALIVSEAASRGGMVWFWRGLPLARKNGTAALAGEPTRFVLRKALILTLLIVVIFGSLCFGVLWIIGCLLVLLLFIRFFSTVCCRRIGGYTGDTLGAIQQCLTVLILALTCIVH
ncbi:adenosylcobinamide-GDP ribazoletransferase [uncultured Bartonella sp.]|uniref:adenosylcobinamide-GDP ribazoletransferase n=1 Tax=uncultured Bartonella sp. TaxID=104108 RepID=UPI0026069D3E|nr:adenosylcobinamide-GDP ribazoletransferase [uncultured Bartonella sp.]